MLAVMMEHDKRSDDDPTDTVSTIDELSTATVPLTSTHQRRLDFGSIIDNSDIRRSELGLLLNYAIVPEDEDSDDAALEKRYSRMHHHHNNNNNNSSNSSSHKNNNSSPSAISIDENEASTVSQRNNYGKVKHSNNVQRRRRPSNNSKPLSIITTVPTYTKNARPAVWIEAEAGVGKSSLLQQFRTEIKESYPHRVVLMQGKFEPRAAASEPFAALREAVNEFVQSFLLTLPEQDSFRQEWATGLREKMNNYGVFSLFLGILPELRPCFDAEMPCGNKPVVEDDDDDDSNPFGNFNSREYRFERFRVAFRNMIRFTCRKLWRTEQKRGLVLILDDFHWVDPDSMQIVKSLMEDPRKPHNFRLIAATRPLDDHPNVLNLYTILTVPTEAVSDSHATLRSLAASRRNIGNGSPRETTQKVSFSTTAKNPNSERLRHGEEASQSEISETTLYRRIPNLEMMELARLSTKQIADMLHTLLVTRPYDEDDDDNDDEYLLGLLELARITKEKTQGNTFVVVQFLRLLERKNLFTYEDEHFRWNFDTKEIEKVDYQSENVSKVVTETLESGSKRQKSALMIAASFGVSQFDVPTIVHASKVVEGDASESSDHDDDADDPIVVQNRVNRMKEQLAEALKDGFVEMTPTGNFRFAHDRIRESAYSLLPEGPSRKEVHLKVGRQLRAWMDAQEECKFTCENPEYLNKPMQRTNLFRSSS